MGTQYLIDTSILMCCQHTHSWLWSHYTSSHSHPNSLDPPILKPARLLPTSGPLHLLFFLQERRSPPLLVPFSASCCFSSFSLIFTSSERLFQIFCSPFPAITLWNYISWFISLMALIAAKKYLIYSIAYLFIIIQSPFSCPH